MPVPTHPTDIGGLFAFYYDIVKILYSAAQAENELPQETLFEINAAFDHLSRHWSNGEDEAYVVEKAFSHLKRSCLDIFKIKVRDAVDQYQKLMGVDTSVIDGGRFDLQLHQLMHEIKQGATEARRVETQNASDDHDTRIPAFDMWQDVYEKCQNLERDFFLHRDLDWARKKSRQYGRKTFFASVAGSFVAGVLLKSLISLVFRWTGGG